jgi:hypothetical protein
VRRRRGICLRSCGFFNLAHFEGFFDHYGLVIAEEDNSKADIFEFFGMRRIVVLALSRRGDHAITPGLFINTQL